MRSPVMFLLSKALSYSRQFPEWVSFSSRMEDQTSHAMSTALPKIIGAGIVPVPTGYRISCGWRNVGRRDVNAICESIETTRRASQVSIYRNAPSKRIQNHCIPRANGFWLAVTHLKSHSQRCFVVFDTPSLVFTITELLRHAGVLQCDDTDKKISTTIQLETNQVDILVCLSLLSWYSKCLFDVLTIGQNVMQLYIARNLVIETVSARCRLATTSDLWHCCSAMMMGPTL